MKKLILLFALMASVFVVSCNQVKESPETSKLSTEKIRAKAFSVVSGYEVYYVKETNFVTSKGIGIKVIGSSHGSENLTSNTNLYIDKDDICLLEIVEVGRYRVVENLTKQNTIKAWLEEYSISPEKLDISNIRAKALSVISGYDVYHQKRMLFITETGEEVEVDGSNHQSEVIDINSGICVNKDDICFLKKLENGSYVVISNLTKDNQLKAWSKEY